MNTKINPGVRLFGGAGANAKLLLLSFLAIPVQMAVSTDASAATIYGSAVGSFCCAMDQNGAPATNGGDTRFTFANNDATTTARFTWGETTKTNKPVNSFEFNGSGSNIGNGNNIGSQLGSTATGNLFQIGTFDYYNGSTKKDNIGRVTFNLNMSVLNGSAMMPFPTLQFDFSIINTSDPQCSTQTCRDAARDSVTIANVWMINGSNKTAFTGPMDFTLDGAHYNFNLNGFAELDASGNPMRDASGNVKFATSVLAYEDNMIKAAIYGSITPATVVPAPAAFWLFGSGFAGLAGLAFRKRDRQNA